MNTGAFTHSSFSQMHNVGIIVNFVFSYICSFLLHLHQLKLVNVKLKYQGYIRIAFQGYTLYETRKSSCGKPQEAYHLRHNLPKHILSRGGGGRGGIPTLDGWGYLPWGTPCPDLAGRGTYLGEGTYLGVPPPPWWTDWKRNLPPYKLISNGRARTMLAFLYCGQFMKNSIKVALCMREQINLASWLG